MRRYPIFRPWPGKRPAGRPGQRFPIGPGGLSGKRPMRPGFAPVGHPIGSKPDPRVVGKQLGKPARPGIAGKQLGQPPRPVRPSNPWMPSRGPIMDAPGRPGRKLGKKKDRVAQAIGKALR